MSAPDPERKRIENLLRDTLRRWWFKRLANNSEDCDFIPALARAVIADRKKTRRKARSNAGEK